nr:MAG TPA: hypothetical protein [Caudoviricetes sp.]
MSSFSFFCANYIVFILFFNNKSFVIAIFSDSINNLLYGFVWKFSLRFS